MAPGPGDDVTRPSEPRPRTGSIAPVRPPLLRAGDHVAVVSPSSDLAGRYPARLRQALAAVESLGLVPRLMPNATLSAPDGVPARLRASDLMDAFTDPEIAGVFATIGGSGAVEVLPLLDFEVIGRQPKAFVGYSDVTVLHSALASHAGWVTYYGPSLMMELGDWPAPFAETLSSLRNALFDPELDDRTVFTSIVLEGTDWAAPHERKRETAPPPRALRSGVGRGRLTGGCLPLVGRMLGTPWSTELSSTVLVLETPQLPYSANEMRADLWQLRRAGVLNDLAALIVGWPFVREQLDALVEAVEDVLPADTDYPVLVGFPVGHTSPMHTLPLGMTCRLDARRSVLSFGAEP